jgi:hypothetical protein
MRYARGMFRLWLVLSCFWIAIVAIIFYSNWPSPTVPEQASKSEYVPEWARDPTNAFADFVPVDQKPDPSVLVRSAAELAFVPPALIFVVGIGLTWALRGFRPR